ncbi:MAG: leucine-rich repeat domain-containing protein [Duncaniella sp.]|nr:leucine-rich repeat domain-containing protein [Duncaniella sp.]
MKRQVLLACMNVAYGLTLFAAVPKADWVCVNEVEISVSDLYSDTAGVADSDMLKVTVLDRVTEADSSDPVKFEAVVTEPGTLADVIGDRLTEIDEIEVRGLVNDADFSTLWQASFEGKLKVVDLSKAFAVDDLVPDYAFYHQDVQMDSQSHKVKTIALEKLYLPQGVTEIGSGMAMYCSNLAEVKLDAPLKKIGASAFFMCTSLAAESFELPEGLEEVGRTAFCNDSALEGELVLPASLTTIGSNAFASTGFTSVTFNGPAYVGSQAFMRSKLTEVVLPDGCTFDDLRGRQFAMCYSLTKATLPADLKAVAFGMFNTCTSLDKLELPDGLETIGAEAFSNIAVTELQLPEGMTAVGEDAFHGCAALESLTLPSTLSEIGEYAFGLCTGLKDIYSKIVYPSATKAFTGVDYNSAVVYIPEGTKELYCASEGWSNFVNFVEVKAMGGVDVIAVDAVKVTESVYDLYGRRVENLTPGRIYISGGRKFVGK